MTFFNQLATSPAMGAFDMAFKNYGATPIPANSAVTVDTANFIGAGATADQIGIVPVAASGNPGIGITQEVIPPKGAGRVRCFGPTVQGPSDGAISVGGLVDFSGTAGRAFVAHAAGKFHCGLALSTAADLDEVLVLMFGANNA